MKKRIPALLLAAALLFGLSGCTLAKRAKTKIEEAKQIVTGTQKVYNVCNLVNGNLGDKSFFDSCEAGLKALEEEGRITYTTLELGAGEMKQPLWLSTLYEVSESGDYDLIICGSPDMEESMAEVAPKYPNQHYMHYDDATTPEKFPNVVHVVFRENEIGYLVGSYLGLMAKEKIERTSGSNTLGFVGGVDGPVINNFLIGFIEGAQAVNPTIKIDTRYTNDYANPALAKEYALSMLSDNRCDYIWGVAGRSGNGVAEAVEESGRSWFIGVDSDQELALPKELAAVTLGSGTKDVGGSVRWLLDEMEDGHFYYGHVVSLGLREGAVGFVNDKNVAKYTPENVQKEYEDILISMLSGEATVDTTSTEHGAELAVKLREQVRP